MNDPEKIRQQIFDNINAMSDEELQKTVHQSDVLLGFVLFALCFGTASILVLEIILICIYLAAMIFFMFSFSALQRWVRKTIAVVLYLIPVSFLLPMEYVVFGWTIFLVLLDVFAVMGLRTSLAAAFEEKYAADAWECRQKKCLFTLDAIKIPSEKQYYIRLVAVNCCFAIIILFFMQIPYFIHMAIYGMINLKQYFFLLTISGVILLFSAVATAVWRALKNKHFCISDFLVSKLKHLLFIAVLAISPCLSLYFNRIEPSFGEPEKGIWYHLEEDCEIEAKIMKKGQTEYLKITVWPMPFDRPEEVQMVIDNWDNLFFPFDSVKASVGGKPVKFKKNASGISFFIGKLDGALEIELTLANWVKDIGHNPHAIHNRMRRKN